MRQCRLKAPVQARSCEVIQAADRSEPRPGKPRGSFREVLKQALTADARRPRHERRTARALYAEIKAAGYGGGYTRLTDFIRAWRQGEGQGVSTTAFVPLVLEIGEAFQFDWSEEGPAHPGQIWIGITVTSGSIFGRRQHVCRCAESKTGQPYGLCFRFQMR